VEAILNYMSAYRKIYNLNFLKAEDFKPFNCMQYEFMPIPEKQPMPSSIHHSRDFNSNYRKHSVNAKVKILGRQKNSLLYRSGIINNGTRRYRKFIDDVLLVISILLGRNVILFTYRDSKTFPLAAGKHCKKVCYNSEELKLYLKIAIETITSPEWQSKYENGFHLIMFNNYADIQSIESRFISNIKIWEFLYAQESLSNYTTFLDHYNHLLSTKLETKLCSLIRKHIIGMKNLRKENLKIFVYLRNQLTHYGKLPIIIPDSPDWIKNLSWDEIEKYLYMFEFLTHVLVLSTINIKALDCYDFFNLKGKLDKIIQNGKI